MQLINQYSALLLFVIPIGFLVMAVFWRKRPLLSRAALLTGLVLIGAAGFFILQTESRETPLGEVEMLLASGIGRPVLLELYSDY
jgi:hypothetical protein